MHEYFWILCYVNKSHGGILNQNTESAVLLPLHTDILKIMLLLYILLSIGISVTSKRQLQNFPSTERGWFANISRPHFVLILLVLLRIDFWSIFCLCCGLGKICHFSRLNSLTVKDHYEEIFYFSPLFLTYLIISP